MGSNPTERANFMLKDAKDKLKTLEALQQLQNTQAMEGRVSSLEGAVASLSASVEDIKELLKNLNFDLDAIRMNPTVDKR